MNGRAGDRLLTTVYSAHPELREGDRVTCPLRAHWGVGVILDAHDTGLLVIDFSGRRVKLGRAMIEPITEASEQ